jgi:phosphopantetheinyl transferase (holo-ACP synthase)
LAGFEEERNSTSKGKDSMSGKHSYMQQRHNVKEIMHKSALMEQGLHKYIWTVRTGLHFLSGFLIRRAQKKIGKKHYSVWAVNFSRKECFRKTQNVRFREVIISSNFIL